MNILDVPIPNSFEYVGKRLTTDKQIERKYKDKNDNFIITISEENLGIVEKQFIDRYSKGFGLYIRENLNEIWIYPIKAICGFQNLQVCDDLFMIGKVDE